MTHHLINNRQRTCALNMTFLSDNIFFIQHSKDDHTRTKSNCYPKSCNCYTKQILHSKKNCYTKFDDTKHVICIAQTAMQRKKKWLNSNPAYKWNDPVDLRMLLLQKLIGRSDKSYWKEMIIFEDNLSLISLQVEICSIKWRNASIIPQNARFLQTEPRKHALFGRWKVSNLAPSAQSMYLARIAQNITDENQLKVLMDHALSRI